MLQEIEVDSGLPSDVGRQIRAGYAQALRLAIDGGAATMPPEAIPFHNGKSRSGYTLVGTRSVGPSGPGWLGSASSHLQGNTAAGTNDELLQLPANSDWTCQFVVDNIGAVSGIPCWFRSGSGASSGNLFLATDTRRPWVRVSGNDVLRPSTGPQWTDGQTINLIVRCRNASRIEAWWDGAPKHSATHSSSLPELTGIEAIYYLLTNSVSDELRGNAAAIRFWSRYLTDGETLELAADPGAFYEDLPAWSPVGAGTTSVESDFTASYSVVGTVSKDLAASYTVVAAVDKDLAASYAVQVAVTQDLAASYSVVGTVSKDLAASYTVVAAVDKDLAASYAVQVAVTQDLAASYSVTGTVTKDFTASYDLLADSTVTKDFTGSYTITGSVESDLDASYSVHEAVSKDLTASYTVVAAVQKDLTASYSIQVAGTGATADEIATAVWAKIGEDGLPYGDLVRVLLAALSGRTEGIGTLNERYLSADGSKTRIDATFDSNNNRVAVTLDGTP